MDAAPDLLPSAFFSPSKAKQQRAQAQDWQHVDTWLASKYQGRSVPQFERNEDTLKALLALVAANEKADEERELLWNVQKESLHEIQAQKQSRGSIDHILNKLMSSLSSDGKSSLESLSTSAVTLNSATDAESMVGAVAMEIQTSHSLSQSLMQLQHLQARLEYELLSLRSQLNEVRSQAFQPPMSLPRQTMEWNRNTKQLRAKLEEYDNRLASLDGGNDTSAASLVEDVASREEQVDELSETVRKLETQLQAFKGLPKNKNAARKEVQRVEKELTDLQKQRDALFESLVEVD